jgi:hypothetical protein
MGDPACGELRAVLGIGAHTRAALIATEGPTDPAAYAAAVA